MSVTLADDDRLEAVREVVRSHLLETSFVVIVVALAVVGWLLTQVAPPTTEDPVLKATRLLGALLGAYALAFSIIGGGLYAIYLLSRGLRSLRS